MKRLPGLYKSKKAFAAYAATALVLLGTGFYFAPSRQVEPVFEGVYASLETADRLVAQEEYGEAIRELKRYLERDDLDDFGRWEALNTLAAVYAQYGDHNGAYATYRQLEELEEELSFGTAIGIAEAAWAFEDIHLAIEYLETALELIQELEGADVDELEAQIKADLTVLEEITPMGPSGIYEVDVLMRRGEIAEEFDRSQATDFYNQALELIEPELPEHDLPEVEEEEIDLPLSNIERVAQELREKVDALNNES